MPWNWLVPLRVTGVDDATGGLAILGGVVAGDDGELADGVDAEVDANDRSRATVGVVVDADAVEAVVVLRWASAGDGDLRAESAIAAAGALVEALLRGDTRDARLQRGEVGPAAAVQWQVADDGAGDHRAER